MLYLAFVIHNASVREINSEPRSHYLVYVLEYWLYERGLGGYISCSVLCFEPRFSVARGYAELIEEIPYL